MSVCGVFARLCVCEIMASSLVEVLENADGIEIISSVDDVGGARSEERMTEGGSGDLRAAVVLEVPGGEGRTEVDALREELRALRADTEGDHAVLKHAHAALESVMRRATDFRQTQIRSVETYVGRARRETFHCRLKYKREIEQDARVFLKNLDRQIDRVRTRVAHMEAEVWPGGGPSMQELRTKFEA